MIITAFASFYTQEREGIEGRILKSFYSSNLVLQISSAYFLDELIFA